MPSLEEILADLAVRQPAVGPDPRAGALQPRTPSLRENVAAFLAGDQAQGLRGNIIEKLLGSRGAGSSGPGPSGTGLVDYAPLVNIPFATNEARRSAEAGDIPSTALNAMAAIPLVGAAGKAGKAAKAVKTAAETIPTPGLGSSVAKPIRAYHGSPHSFDRFDISRIGTGEGAQAYGHGLYFAENPDVARGYRDSLTGDPNLRVGRTPIQNFYTDIENRAARLPPQRAQPEYDKLALLEDLMHQGDVAAIRNAAENYTPEATAWFDRSVAPHFTRQGHMYEVDIHADPSRFLDWDKPLAQQSPEVQRALEPFGWKYDREGMRAYDDALLAALTDAGPPTLPKQPANPSGAEIWQRVARERYATRPDLAAPWGPGGKTYEESLASVRGDPARVQRIRSGSPVDRAQALYDAGIPGIRYLDQGSRGTGTGSSNYVTFTDAIVDIIRKYGLAGLAPGLGAGVAATQFDGQPPQ